MYGNQIEMLSNRFVKWGIGNVGDTYTQGIERSHHPLYLICCIPISSKMETFHSAKKILKQEGKTLKIALEIPQVFSSIKMSSPCHSGSLLLCSCFCQGWCCSKWTEEPELTCNKDSLDSVLWCNLVIWTLDVTVIGRGNGKSNLTKWFI